MTWQHAHGRDANADGIIDPWELVAPAPSSATQPGSCSSYRADYAYPIQLCGSGEGVRVAQVALRTAVDPDLAADGYFGPITQAAVRAFQSLRVLPVTGEIDELTWEALTGGSADGDEPTVTASSIRGRSACRARVSPRRARRSAVNPLSGPSCSASRRGSTTLASGRSEAAVSAGYPGTTASFCAGEAGTAAAAAVGQPPGSYFIVAVPFRGEEVARHAQQAFAASGVQTAVALLLTDRFR